MTNIGYARVSTEDQNLDMQTDALRERGCERIFEEKASGKDRNRPELERMFEFLREGDVVYVWKLDRLGRSLHDLLDLTARMNSMGVEFVSIRDGFDTTTPSGRLYFNIMAVLSEYERSLIAERTQSGLESARARGRVGGRPRTDTAALEKAYRLYDSREFTIPQIADACGISESTFYKYNRARKAQGGQ